MLNLTPASRRRLAIRDAARALARNADDAPLALQLVDDVEDPDCAAVTLMFKSGVHVAIPPSPFDDGFGGSAA